jgi:hypothetical protein
MTCKNNFGADAPSQPIPVLKGRVCGRVSRINSYLLIAWVIVSRIGWRR